MWAFLEEVDCLMTIIELLNYQLLFAVLSIILLCLHSGDAMEVVYLYI